MEKIDISISENYINIVSEYFESISNYVNLNLVDNHSLFLSNGLNIIKNIFEYTLITKKNLVTVDLYSHRAFYYYLEYVKQIQEAEMHLDIDYTKTSVFVYERIVGEINNDDTNSIANILSLNDENNNLMNIDIKDLINQINIFIHNLFNLNSRQRIDGCNEKIKRNINIIKKYYKSANLINKYVNLLKEKIDMSDEDNYKVILNTCLMLASSRRKTDDNLVNLIKKFYINEDTLTDNYKKLNTKDFVYWLVFHNNR